MSHLSEEQLDQIVAEERARPQPPLNEWRTIAARAREEGLIRESSSSGWVSSQPWMQAAAAVLLLVGGIGIGRSTTGLPSATQTPTAPQLQALPLQRIRLWAPHSARAIQPSLPSRKLRPRSTGPSTTTGAPLHSSPRTTPRHAPAIVLAMYSARLVALDKVFDATESALETAPHDPVINQYYLATMGARAATRQMVARPVALRGF